MSKFRELKAKGKDVEKAVNIIRDAVTKLDITKGDAMEFAEELHPDVKGIFIQDQDQKNQFGPREMSKILGDFFNKKAYSLSSKDIVDELVRALRGADNIEAGDRIAKEIEKACSQDISGSPAAESTASENIGMKWSMQKDLQTVIGEENLKLLRRYCREAKLKVVPDIRAMAQKNGWECLWDLR